MFKKVLLTALLVVAMIFALISCDNHEHDFSNDWSYDEDMHWHECESDGCSQTKDKADHEFEENDDGEMVCKVCGAAAEKSTAPDHEHIFSESYSHNENSHWYACTVEGCTAKDERHDHAYSNPEVFYASTYIEKVYVCVDCRYNKVEVVNIDSVIDGETAWSDAFTNLAFSNYSAVIKYSYDRGDGTVGYQENVVYVTETSAYYKIQDYVEFYTQKNKDGSFSTYIRFYNEEKFTLLNDKSANYLIGASTEPVIQLSFADHFHSFVYDEATGSYKTDDVIDAKYYSFEGELYGYLYCYNIDMKVMDGMISYINTNYYFDEDIPATPEYYLTYFNIGMTSVSIPQNIINSALADDGYHDYYNDDYGNGEDYEGNTGSGNGTYEEDSFGNQYDG